MNQPPLRKSTVVKLNADFSKKNDDCKTDVVVGPMAQSWGSRPESQNRQMPTRHARCRNPARQRLSPGLRREKAPTCCYPVIHHRLVWPGPVTAGKTLNHLSTSVNHLIFHSLLKKMTGITCSEQSSLMRKFGCLSMKAHA